MRISPDDSAGRGTPPMWRRYVRLRGTDVRADVADELDFHVEMIAARHVADGMAPEAARARALAEFGDRERARRACEAIGMRRERRHELRELAHSIARDAAFALRSLRRSPGLATAIVLTLALGIGASTAIFSVVRGVLLRPLPFADPSRLVQIWETSPRGDDHNVVSPGNYLSWRAQARSFTVMGAHRAPYGMTLLLDGEPARVTGTDVTPSVMQTLGARAALGRTLTSEDDRSDGRVVVLSHRFWQRRFALDRRVVGRSLMLNDVAHTVIGIMPRDFEFPAAGVDLWRAVPADRIDASERRSHNWYVVARLAPGATVSSAGAEMRAIAVSLTREYPQSMTGYGTNVVSMHDDLVAPVRPLVLVLMAGAILLLLVACANVANLLLARAMARRREVAVRAALGAGRGRLVRQLVTESLVIALAGGVLGVGAGAALTGALVATAPSDIPRLTAVHVDGGVLAFALVATLLAGLLFGLAPATRLAVGGAGGQALHLTLRAAGDRGGSDRHGLARSVLLVGELAVSLVLLIGAGLLLRSASHLAAVDYGFRPAGLVTAALDLPHSRYRGSERHVAFYEQLMGEVAILPGVVGVATTAEELGSQQSTTFSFAIEGRPSQNRSGREDPQALRAVAGDYFRVMGIPVRRGRVFTREDRSGAPAVVVVNEALARALWPGGDALGARISFAGQSGPWMRIVGVVGDTRSNAADQPPAPALYIPFAQKSWDWMTWSTLVVRTRAADDTVATAAALRATVRRLDPELPIHRVATVGELFRESVARRRFATTLTAAFAVAALVLGMIGMYGVLSYTVVQRRREFGIRMALGAQAGNVTGVVVREALALAGAAIFVGTIGALGTTRLLSGLLYGVSPTDPATFAGVALVVILVASAAAWVPARRATKIDPALTIRDA